MIRIISAVCCLVLPYAHHPWYGLCGKFIIVICDFLSDQNHIFHILFRFQFSYWHHGFYHHYYYDHHYPHDRFYQVGFMSAVTTTICDSFPDVEKKLIAKVFHLNIFLMMIMAIFVEKKLIAKVFSFQCIFDDVNGNFWGQQITWRQMSLLVMMLKIYDHMMKWSYYDMGLIKEKGTANSLLMSFWCQCNTHDEELWWLGLKGRKCWILWFSC